MHQVIDALKGEVRGYYEPLRSFVCDDYLPLKLDDRALLDFVAIFDVQGSIERSCISDVLKEVQKGFRRDFNGPGIAGYDDRECKAIDDLLKLRKKVGGWRQLDRLFKHVAGKSLSGIFDDARLLTDQNDPARGGDTCYSMDIRHYEYGNPFLIFKAYVSAASSPEILMGLLPEAVKGVELSSKSRAEDPWAILISKNGQLLCRIPFSSRGLNDEATLNFAKVEWEKHDARTMKALSALAPREASIKIRSQFLSDELGL